MSAACARLSDAWSVVGMVTVACTRSRISFGSPLSSRPNTSAAGPSCAAVSASAAAAFGSISRSLALRRRAVKPATYTQSATAASNDSKRSMRWMRSMVPCAIPSSLMTSYSTGRTRRSRLRPMFFIARTVAAMLMGFCGSNSTTTTEERSDSDIVDLERDQSISVLPVAAQVDEVTVRTAQNELAASPLPAGGHLVHDHIDRGGNWRQLEVELVADVHGFPSRARYRDRDW